MGFPFGIIAPSPARMSPWTIPFGGTAVPPNRLRKRVFARRITNFQEAVTVFSFIFLEKALQRPDETRETAVPLDRLLNETEIFRTCSFPHFPLANATSCGIIALHPTRSVSYTHLDVYKRQMQFLFLKHKKTSLVDLLRKVLSFP